MPWASTKDIKPLNKNNEMKINITVTTNASICMYVHSRNHELSAT